MTVHGIGWGLLPLAAYLLGSVPWGLLLTRWRAPGVDLRRSGSGNIGATNVRRTAGWPLGLATLAADAAKGGLPTVLALALAPVQPPWAEAYGCLVAATPVLGHMYPVYSGLRRGGKGVATAAGSLLVISPLALAVCMGLFTAVAVLMRRVSVASLAATAVMPLALWHTTASVWWTAWGLGIMALIWVRHRDNLVRLSSGREPRL